MVSYSVGIWEQIIYLVKVAEKKLNIELMHWSMLVFLAYACWNSAGLASQRCRKGEEYKEKCMVPTVKHGGGSVLMWGCMSAAGVGELHFIDGIMNSQMYCSILKEKMLPSLRALGRRALFQHDNDPKHTSKATVGFLKKNRVKVIQWPSMSPDLNPIEHVWGILKRQVEHHSPSGIQSLKEVILEEWKKIDLAKCRQLVHSMPRRLGAVIKNHGGHTKY